MRPHLAPGLHVLRRPDSHLQIGLDRARAVVLADTPAVRRDLRLLTRGELDSEADVPEQARRLLRRPAARRKGRVAVVGFGHPSGAVLVELIARHLRDVGLSRARTVPDVAVLVGAGEPCRTLVDQWMQLGTPHVIVRLVEAHATIGPFVVPGATACLRCTDAFATDEDPAWPLLLEQYSSACVRDRADGAPEPVDPLLAALAAAWAARDVSSYLQGQRPSSWSAGVRLDPLLHDLHSIQWLRHPACGCTWTMDA